MLINKKAKEVADRILAGEQHETIEWHTDNYVVLNINKIIPETNFKLLQIAARGFGVS